MEMLSNEEIHEEAAWRWAKPLVERIEECLKEYGYTLEPVKLKPICILHVRRGCSIIHKDNYPLSDFYKMLASLFRCVTSMLQHLFSHQIGITCKLESDSDQGEVRIALRLRLPGSVCYRMLLEFRADLQHSSPDTFTARLRIEDLNLDVVQCTLTEMPQKFVDSVSRLVALSLL
jgi:hypothetical protein